MTDHIWKIEKGDGPVVATAIHDGTALRDDVRGQMVISPGIRRREEDPHTAEWTHIGNTRVVGLHSRFEVDLNRPRATAVYREPDDCWGLEVWSDGVSDDTVEASLAQYDAFYKMLRGLYGGLAATHERFVVFDLHTYNHRRTGPDAPPADAALNPQVNVGTGTMRNRTQWATLIDRFIHDLSAFDFPGGKLDVRENVKFRGGEHARWAHEEFPDSACVLAVEVKKFFMDEWTGQADQALLNAIGKALASTVPGVLEELARG